MTYEQEKRSRMLFTEPNGKYNYYQLNKGNPVISRFMDAVFPPQYQPCGDRECIQFERVVWELIRKWYPPYKRKKGIKSPSLPPLYEPCAEGLTYKKIPPEEHIANNVLGYAYEYLENFVNVGLDVDKAVELFKKEWGKCLDSSPTE